MGTDSEAVGVVAPPRGAESLKLALEELMQNPAKRLALYTAASRKWEVHDRLPDLARRWVEPWPDTKLNSLRKQNQKEK